MEVRLGFVVLLGFGLLAGVMVYFFGALVATLRRVLQWPWYRFRGRRPPTWWACFKGLDGGNT